MYVGERLQPKTAELTQNRGFFTAKMNRRNATAEDKYQSYFCAGSSTLTISVKAKNAAVLPLKTSGFRSTIRKQRYFFIDR
jgi:hypothetical protein